MFHEHFCPICRGYWSHNAPQCEGAANVTMMDHICDVADLTATNQPLRRESLPTDPRVIWASIIEGALFTLGDVVLKMEITYARTLYLAALNDLNRVRVDMLKGAVVTT